MVFVSSKFGALFSSKGLSVICKIQKKKKEREENAWPRSKQGKYLYLLELEEEKMERGAIGV